MDTSNSVKLSTFLVCSIFLVLGLEAAVQISLDPCPAPYKPGDTWNRGSCAPCQCLAPGYLSCYRCGVSSLYIPKDMQCYAYANENEPYPACCQLHMKCRGEAGFDEKMLLGYMRRLYETIWSQNGISRDD